MTQLIHTILQFLGDGLAIGCNGNAPNLYDANQHLTLISQRLEMAIEVRWFIHDLSLLRFIPN